MRAVEDGVASFLVGSERRTCNAARRCSRADWFAREFCYYFLRGSRCSTLSHLTDNLINRSYLLREVLLTARAFVPSKRAYGLNGLLYSGNYV